MSVANNNRSDCLCIFFFSKIVINPPIIDNFFFLFLPISNKQTYNNKTTHSSHNTLHTEQNIIWKICSKVCGLDWTYPKHCLSVCSKNEYIRRRDTMIRRINSYVNKPLPLTYIEPIMFLTTPIVPHWRAGSIPVYNVEFSTLCSQVFVTSDAVVRCV